jgi:hypothetical protein
MIRNATRRRYGGGEAKLEKLQLHDSICIGRPQYCPSNYDLPLPTIYAAITAIRIAIQFRWLTFAGVVDGDAATNSSDITSPLISLPKTDDLICRGKPSP